MKKRILIVDPDKQLNQINEKILKSSGLVSEVHIASNGLEALDYLHSRIEKEYSLPDIIILELNMPVMNGFKFLDHFREMNFPNKAGIEIVVFTASSNPSDKQKAVARGVKHYLEKPYILRGLNDVIKRMPVWSLS